MDINVGSFSPVWPGRIVWPQVRQICTSQTEKFSRYTLILYFSPIQYWRNCRKICQTVSDRPKIMEKFSQPADENGHVLLPGSVVAAIWSFKPRWVATGRHRSYSIHTRMHYLAGPAHGANIVKKFSPWGPQYCAPDFNIAPLVA